ncbi:MAG: hypothetical protein ACLQU1_16615 [Bryobacteraceae bacterium]
MGPCQQRIVARGGDLFQSSRGAIALAVSLLDLVVTFAASGAGRLVDRYGARRVIVTPLLALAVVATLGIGKYRKLL